MVCTKPILKLLFKNPLPKNTLQGMEFKVFKFEDMPDLIQGTPEPNWDAAALAKVSSIS